MLVFEYRIVSYEYFKHEMSIAEAYECVENIQYLDRDFKELTRYSILATYNNNPYRKRPLNFDDVLPLPWDKKHISVEEAKHKGDFNQDLVQTDEEINEAKEKIRNFEEMMRSGKVSQEYKY